MLSNYLKEHSRTNHDRIEKSIDLILIASAPDLYLKKLILFYGYYAALEPVLMTFNEDFNHIGIELTKRLKIKLLKSDLKFFGFVDDSINDLQVCQRVPLPQNIFEAMGVLYVLEGSTLGGQIISKQLVKANIINSGDGGNFFKSYGSDTLAMWNQYKETLNQLPADKNIIILEKVKETFQTLEDWLSK